MDTWLPLFTKSELARLREIATALELDVPRGFVPQCQGYLVELTKWNRKMNLVSRADEKRIVERHLLDSLCLLSVERRLAGKKIVDVGSGAGFPGLVLAMWERDAVVFLVESRSKRVAFLNAARRTLGLDNVQVVHSRAEDLARPEHSSGPLPPLTVDIVVSRAVGGAVDLVVAVRNLLKINGLLVLYKRRTQSGELEDAESFRERGFDSKVVTPAWNTQTRLLVLRKLS